jgi:hypothetical protein
VIEGIKISPSIARAIREKTGKDVPAAMYEYAEPTMNFYIGRKITHLRNESEVIAWLNNAGQRVLIIPKKDFNGIRPKTSDVDFEEIASKQGINYSKGTELEVVALVSKKNRAQ